MVLGPSVLGCLEMPHPKERGGGLNLMASKSHFFTCRNEMQAGQKCRRYSGVEGEALFDADTLFLPSKGATRVASCADTCIISTKRAKEYSKKVQEFACIST